MPKGTGYKFIECADIKFVSIPHEVIRCAYIKPAIKVVLAVIASHKPCFMSIDNLAHEVPCGEKSVRRAIDFLRDLAEINADWFVWKETRSKYQTLNIEAGIIGPIKNIKLPTTTGGRGHGGQAVAVAVTDKEYSDRNNPLGNGGDIYNPQTAPGTNESQTPALPDVLINLLRRDQIDSPGVRTLFQFLLSSASGENRELARSLLRASGLTKTQVAKISTEYNATTSLPSPEPRNAISLHGDGSEVPEIPSGTPEANGKSSVASKIIPADEAASSVKNT